MHHKAKLTNAQVKQMRKEHLAYIRGYGYLANKYGCGVSTALDIVNFYTRINVC